MKKYGNLQTSFPALEKKVKQIRLKSEKMKNSLLYSKLQQVLNY